MSDFTGLITSTMKTTHVDMITEVLRGCSVPCTLYFGDTKYTDCPNCIYDPINKRSSGRYQSGGPIVFSNGACPYCHGAGRIPQDDSENLSLCPIYDYRSWIPTISSNVQSPEGYVQTMSVFSTRKLIVRAKEIIIDTTITSSVRTRMEKHGEPEICGLGGSDFVITMWKRIENG